MSSETVISDDLIPIIRNAINDLTFKLNNLTVVNTAEPPATKNQQISLIILETYFNVYPEPESLITKISEEFYTTMLADIDIKEEIYGCP
ncbi:hypothetical protein AYI70_g2958 [Smittium culicis]|uniref:Uncharacterized protein n=1 Tax=Smittium culicis TaxID=133412 RepID=A0A1R1Y639_9FUNG|nr:hypothetical protein AYI70_g2958 [Smittium culicis]